MQVTLKQEFLLLTDLDIMPLAWCHLQAQTAPRMGRTALVVTQKCHLSCFCCCFCAQGAAAPSCGQVKAREVARLTLIPRWSVFLALDCGTCTLGTIEEVTVIEAWVIIFVAIVYYKKTTKKT